MQLHNTPTALDSIAQGRGPAAHPGAPTPNRGEYPNGVGQWRMTIAGTCPDGERDCIDANEIDVGSLMRVYGGIVKPRWGLDNAMRCGPSVRRVPRATLGFGMQRRWR